MSINFLDIIKSNPQILTKSLKLKDIKSIIKQKIGIKNDEQSFKINIKFKDEENDEKLFWKCINFEISNFYNFSISIKKDIFSQKLEIKTNNNIENIKKKVYEETGIPIDRQKLYSDDLELKAQDFNKIENILNKEISLKISKPPNKSLLKIVYPNSEIKEIYTDLLNTGIELIKEIQDSEIKESSDIKYILTYNDEIIALNNLLINYGIKTGDSIILEERSTFQVLLKFPTKLNYFIEIGPKDTVFLIKYFIQMREGIPIEMQILFCKGKQLDDDKNIYEYEIYPANTILLKLRLKK